MSADELEASLALDEWEAAQPSPPNIFQVIETGDRRIIGAYILRAFRETTRKAREENLRVMELRDAAYLALETEDEVEGFLRNSNFHFHGRTPLQAAVESDAGREQAVLQLTPWLRGAAVRVIDRLSQVWELSEDELGRLFGAEPQIWRRWRECPDEMPSSAIERISILLSIFRAINTLLPNPPSADGWLRRPNQAPPFGGRSALALLLEGGLPAMREVRGYLEGEIWSR